MTIKNTKPLGIKNYGSIAHLPNSRMGEGDHHCPEGQAKIATVKPRDKHDKIIVQEKLDGSNVGVAKVDGQIYALSRAGYLAETSKYRQHWEFANWVYANQDRFLAVLQDGERLVGEWLMQAHGTRYELFHEPFVAFDLMSGTSRIVYDEFVSRVAAGEFVTPHIVHQGSPISVDEVLKKLGNKGFHGALDKIEGAIWRVERNELIDKGKGGERLREVDFLVKFVRPDKIDGSYLTEISGNETVWNWLPR
jgi:RNA ligase